MLHIHSVIIYYEQEDDKLYMYDKRYNLYIGKTICLTQSTKDKYLPSFIGSGVGKVINVEEHNLVVQLYHNDAIIRPQYIGQEYPTDYIIKNNLPRNKCFLLEDKEIQLHKSTQYTLSNGVLVSPMYTKSMILNHNQIQADGLFFNRLGFSHFIKIK